jgi:hypothetical protein
MNLLVCNQLLHKSRGNQQVNNILPENIFTDIFHKPQENIREQKCFLYFCMFQEGNTENIELVTYVQCICKICSHEAYLQIIMSKTKEENMR